MKKKDKIIDSHTCFIEIDFLLGNKFKRRSYFTETKRVNYAKKRERERERIGIISESFVMFLKCCICAIRFLCLILIVMRPLAVLAYLI